jgi:antitoxin component YwqK of YwqJK toxin-antitoxin module
MLNGPNKVYDNDDNLLLEEFLINGVRHGLATIFYSTGQKEGEGFYNNGNRQGLFLFFSKEGIITYVDHWDNDLREGEFLEFEY